MILLVASKLDIAAVNIAAHLLTSYEFEETAETFRGNPVYAKRLNNGREAKLVFIDEESVNAQFITEFFTPSLVIFLSKHKSKSGIPTLSVHTPGNLGEAALGGISKKVSIAPASAMKEALIEMLRCKDEMELKYEVSYECTHHGPSLDVPAMFVELGSSLEQWRDVRAAEAVARASLAAASAVRVYPTVLGIGGPHYNRKFTRIAVETDIAFGHMIPKYAVNMVDIDVLRQCIERTVEPVERAILDWKGIRGSDKATLIDMLDEVGLEFERV